jgi:nickel/cobalt transporter (NicO) family protein
MNWHRSFLASVAIGAQLLMFSGVANAHATDEYGHNTLLSVTADGIHIESQLTAGPLVSSKLIELIDQDHNELFSAIEISSYGQQIAKDIDVTVDGSKRSVTLITLQAPSVTDLRTGANGLVFSAIAAGPLPVHEFTFVDLHRPLKGPAQVSLLAQSNTPAEVNIIRDIERGIRVKASFASKPKARDETTDASGTGSDDTRGGVSATARITTTSKATSQTTSQATSKTVERTRMLQRYLSDASSPWAMAIALGAAALLGAFHALTPGHGKTLAAAYLIGERATVKHAITLGLSTTVTHTASVVLLGAMSLGFASFIEASELLRALRIGSGLLIVGLGIYLFVKRIGGRHHLQATHGHGAHQHSDHNHSDVGQPEHAESVAVTHQAKSSHASMKAAAHPNLHSAGHSHSHGSAHGHSHGHAHSHLHDRSIGVQPITTRRLIAMGASGGILPCPEALGVLILAVGVRRQVFGMAMIVAFSAGLASVLVAVGITLVRTRSFVQRFSAIPDSVTQTWLPAASALVVTVLGLAILSGRVV